MHCRFYLIFCLIILYSFLSTRIYGQAKLFNVPSATPTKPYNHFFQENTTLTQQFISNTTYSYGLKHEFEIGLYIPNSHLAKYKSPASQIDFLNPPFNNSPLPQLLFTAEKVIHLNNVVTMSFGTQSGLTARSMPVSNSKFATYEYTTFVFEPKILKGTSLHTGAYYGNHAYIADGTQASFMLGYEIPVLKEKLHLVGDYVNGRNALGNTVLGFVIFCGNQLFSFGWQSPNHHTGNGNAMVFEYTFSMDSGYGLMDKKEIREDAIDKNSK